MMNLDKLKYRKVEYLKDFILKQKCIPWRLRETFPFGPKKKYYPFSRTIMYQEINNFLDKHCSGRSTFNVLEIGGSKNNQKAYCLHCARYITINIDGNADIVMDAHKLDFENNVFDLVIIDQVLEHVYYPTKVLGEANRVLKKEGYIIVGVPMLISIHQEPYDFWRFTPAGLELVLKDTGFVNISTGSWGHMLAVKEYLEYSWRGVPSYQKWRKIIKTPNDSTFPIVCWAFGQKL